VTHFEFDYIFNDDLNLITNLLQSTWVKEFWK